MIEIDSNIESLIDSKIKSLPRKVREATLCASFMIFFAVLSSWCLHLPLLVGRFTLSFFRYVFYEFTTQSSVNKDLTQLCVLYLF